MGPPWGSGDGVACVLHDDLHKESLGLCVCSYRGLRAVAGNARELRRDANGQTGCVAESPGVGKFRPVCAVEKDQDARRESLSTTNCVIQPQLVFRGKTLQREERGLVKRLRPG